ncbi:MAG TPA: hypothetical protein VKT78_19550 [Fimbriimonadaceae bacterium]|nr:hypothetical protein [Fimbriimonadaceae bacterium]
MLSARTLLRLAALAAVVSGALSAHAAPVMTRFVPATNGFSFVNSFVNDMVPALDIRTGGLCGGMTYAALDYFNAHMAAPTQPFMPANKTPLYNYLYGRQTDSIMSNLDKWAEVEVNPLGARDTEFFNWGLQATNGGRIQELKSFIDRGMPCPLGMKGALGEGDHQILAIGYDMGRYQGNLGAYETDFKIFVCDPNYNNVIRTLVPDPNRKVYYYMDATSPKGSQETWRTYFVDKNYHAKTPPAATNGHYAADGLAHELVLDFRTGGDDLRGGNDNVNLTLNLMDGTQQVYNDINLSGRWVVNCDQWAEVKLYRPVAYNQIRSAVISTTFTGGIGGDNWNMDKVGIYAWGSSFNGMKSAGPKRFTGEDKVLQIPLNDIPTAPGQINKLLFTFVTGNDDLRGVNDNINLAVHFRNGQIQQMPNANGGARWADNSIHTVELDFNRAAAAADVTGIDIMDTFGGGIGGDNWNMNSVSVRATGNAVNEVIATHGFKRFTGSDKLLSIPVTIAAAGQANKLELTIRTRDDDLRGGNDNVNATIKFRNGTTQFVPNLNGGANWGNNTTHVVDITLSHASLPGDIVEVDLHTTSTGGIGGDNWNMDSISIKALGNGVNAVIMTHGYNRFTGDHPDLRITR